jgi:hypothetical protein
MDGRATFRDPLVERREGFRSSLVQTRQREFDGYRTDRGPTGEPVGAPATLIADPDEIEQLLRNAWAAGWLAAEFHAPGDDEFKRRVWAFMTACVLVHGNINLRNDAPLMAARSHTTWWRLAKRGEDLIGQFWLNHADETELPISKGADSPSADTPEDGAVMTQLSTPTIAERVTALELELQRQKALAAETARQLGLAEDDDRVRQAVDDFLEDVGASTP